jgi:hypothetical protein
MNDDRMRNLRLVHSSTRLEDSSTAAQRADRDLPVAPLAADVRALLEHVRIVTPLPRGVRARVLARARAAIAATGYSASAAANAPARRRSTTIC